MREAHCDRMWQAEASLDGRLSKADSVSFERHATTCSSCEHEVRSLTRLQEVGKQLPELTSTPLERRRQRHELLRRANERLLRPSVPPRRRSRALAWIALAALVTTIAVWQVTASRSDVASAVREVAPTYRMTHSTGATWHLADPGVALRIALWQGRFEFDVDRLQAGQRFVLSLPDGELEVLGTRFVVELAASQTRHVSVETGRVSLRLAGQPHVVLSAGQSWSREEADASGQEARSAADAGPAARRPARGAVAPPRPATGADPADGGADPSPTVSSDPEPKAPSATARSDFARAMSAFGAGDFATAESLFSRFERNHPSDGRVEDSTFLRAVARSRRGDPAGAAVLAREYLRRYPTGLRVPEAERLASP